MNPQVVDHSIVMQLCAFTPCTLIKPDERSQAASERIRLIVKAPLAIFLALQGAARLRRVVLPRQADCMSSMHFSGQLMRQRNIDTRGGAHCIHNIHLNAEFVQVLS